MRNLTRSFVLLAGLAGLGSATWAQCSQTCCDQNCPERRFIIATGTGVARADADLAIVHAMNKAYGPDGKSASASGDVASALILQGLTALDIPKSAIESTSPILQRTQSYELQQYQMGSEERARRQFAVSQVWLIRVKPDQAAAALKAAIDAGANEDASVQWIVENPGQLQAKASVSALADAREIAEQMAQKAGVHLGRLVNADTVQSPMSYGPYNPSTAFGMGDSIVTLGSTMGGTPALAVNSSHVEFKTSVRATYLIEEASKPAK